MSKKALAKQPFAHHLAELRARILLVVISFIIGSILGYLIAKPLLTWLLYPLHQSVYYTSQLEVLMSFYRLAYW